MKKLLLTTVLLIAPIAAQSATYWTPAVIKASLNSTNPMLVTATGGYISGLNQTFKALQNYDMIDKYLCMPDSVTLVEMTSLVSKQSAKGFARTSDGGAYFVFTAFYNKYPCR